MATPIQFIREQLADSVIDASKIASDAVTNAKIADAAVNPEKLELSGTGITYDFGSVVLEAATQSADDNSTKVATTAYVDSAVTSAELSAGAGIDISANKVSIDFEVAASGLTFSGTGDSRQLLIAVSQSTPRGLGLNEDGYLEIDRDVSGALDFDSDGRIFVMVKSNAGILRSAADGLELDLNSSFLEVDATDGLQLVDGGITSGKIANLAIVSDKIATAAVTGAKIASNAITNAKLADNAVKNAEIDDDAVGVDELAITAHYQEFTGDGSTQNFTLTNALAYPAMAQVYKNGQRMSFVTGTPSGIDEYSLGGTDNKDLRFGANVTNGALIQVSHFGPGTPA